MRLMHTCSIRVDGIFGCERLDAPGLVNHAQVVFCLLCEESWKHRADLIASHEFDCHNSGYGKTTNYDGGYELIASQARLMC